MASGLEMYTRTYQLYIHKLRIFKVMKGLRI